MRRTKEPTVTDSIAAVARDALLNLIKAGRELDEADRLLTCHYMGTDKWIQQVGAWRRRKDTLIDRAGLQKEYADEVTDGAGRAP